MRVLKPAYPWCHVVPGHCEGVPVVEVVTQPDPDREVGFTDRACLTHAKPYANHLLGGPPASKSRILRIQRIEPGASDLKYEARKAIGVRNGDE